MGDYTALASMMANHAEAAIFRRFDTLNIKNLLYMQAELVDLENQLHEIESEDKKSKAPNKVAFSSSVQALRRSASTRDNDQWMKYKEVQEKIHAYSMYYAIDLPEANEGKDDALLQYGSLRKVAKPTLNDIEAVREWLKMDIGGALFLKGIEYTTWKSHEDFLCLDPEQAGRDTLTWLINEQLIPWYHRRWGCHWRPSSSAGGDREWDGVRDYPKDKLEMIGNAISALLAALLPSISILILHFVSEPSSRLITISLFNVFFSWILATVSAAKRVEVFIATTALAAVQVLFVSRGGLG